MVDVAPFDRTQPTATSAWVVQFGKRKSAPGWVVDHAEVASPSTIDLTVRATPMRRAAASSATEPMSSSLGHLTPAAIDAAISDFRGELQILYRIVARLSHDQPVSEALATFVRGVRNVLVHLDWPKAANAGIAISMTEAIRSARRTAMERLPYEEWRVFARAETPDATSLRVPSRFVRRGAKTNDEVLDDGTLALLDQLNSR